MTARLVVLFLAVYRVTLLVTADRITRAPRRAVLGWLRKRAHHLADHDTHLALARRIRCSCGWQIERLEGYPDVAALIAEPIPSALDGVDLPRDGVAALEPVFRSHVEDHHDDVGRWGYLLTCPWCVSIYAGLVAAGVWAAWPNGWWYWPGLVLALSGFSGLAASLGSPQDDE